MIVAGKRHQNHGTRTGQPHSNSAAPEAILERKGHFEVQSPCAQYHQFPFVPTDGSYPPDLGSVAPSHEASVRPRGHWQDPRSFRLKELSSPCAQNPIPGAHNITHAILQKEALTKFHVAVYLADADAGKDDVKRKLNLGTICDQYLPAMKHLGIGRHQIVFFYHGRLEIDMGNALWDTITAWEQQEHERSSSEWRKRKEKDDRAWSDLAKHGETTSRVRQGSDFASGCVRGRGGRRERVAIDEEHWPPTAGGQW